MIKIHFLSYFPVSIIVLSFIFLILLVLVSYRWSGISNRKIFWTLHLAAGILILSVLFRPEITLKMKTAGKNPFYVLIDTSMSMGIADSSGKTRLKRVMEFIETHHFIKSLKPVFYQFGGNIKKVPADKIQVLQPSQNATSIARSLYRITKISGGNCAGIILFTDGDETGNAGINRIKNITYPVYVVGTGGGKTPDGSITNVISNSPVFSGETIRISVYGKLTGIPSSDIIVRIKNNNNVLQEKEIHAAGKFFKVDFKIKETVPGKFIWTAEVLPIQGETILQNNSLPFLVRVIPQKIKILYVEGTLRWEYKFLKRFIESNTSFNPVFLIRIGKNIYQQAAGKSISIPADIFGNSQFLEKFNIIILGDIDFSSFTDRDIENLKNFVLSGKGLLFPGGENFLAGIKNTRLDNLMPIILTKDEKTILSGNFIPSITPEAVRLGLFNENYAFPALSRVNNVDLTRPGSIPIMTGQGKNQIIIVAMNKSFEGKTIIVSTDNTWQWNFGDKQSQEAYRYFWTRIFRLLCGPDNVLGIGQSLPDIIIDKKIYGTGEKVHVKFILQHLKSSGINAFLLSPDGEKKPLKIESGSADFIPDTEGVYLVGAEKGYKRVYEDVRVTKYGREFIKTGWNQQYMKNIAHLTGGHYYTLKNASSLDHELQRKKATRTINLTFSKNSDRWVVLIIFALLSACWLLRRRQNIT